MSGIASALAAFGGGTAAAAAGAGAAAAGAATGIAAGAGAAAMTAGEAAAITTGIGLAEKGADQSSQNSKVGTPAQAGASANTSYGYHFYGGETVSQLKNSSAHHVEICGGTDGLKNNEEKGFYKNVHIPRKQV